MRSGGRSRGDRLTEGQFTSQISQPCSQGIVEERMKKTYEAPVLVVNGSAVRETLVGSPNIALESFTSKPAGAGAVGYYL
jgi:hypothetical protein